MDEYHGTLMTKYLALGPSQTWAKEGRYALSKIKGTNSWRERRRGQL